MTSRRWSSAILATAVLTVAACGSSEPSSTGAARSAATGSTNASPEPAGSITLAFGGDIHFADYLAPLATDPNGLAPLKPLWGNADLRMANLETAITDGGSPMAKAFVFRAPASALTTLANAGLTILTQANNHAADYGEVGLADTLAARAASPVPIVGIGKDETDAFSPRLMNVKGLKIAVFGADQVADETTLPLFSAGPAKAGVASSMPTARLVAAVTAARATADVVVVYLHWGFDYQSCPDERSVATARDLEAAGADVIVGAHSHRVNGAGWLGRAYVDYGLGNFVWWRSAEPDSRTGILTLTVDRTKASQPAQARTGPVVTSASWRPLLIGRNGIPAEPAPADATRLSGLWEEARACTGLTAAPDAPG